MYRHMCTYKQTQRQRPHGLHKGSGICPGCVARLVGTLSRIWEGCGSDTQSGHIHKLQVQSLVGVRMGGTKWCFSFTTLSENKYVIGWGLKKKWDIKRPFLLCKLYHPVPVNRVAGNILLSFSSFNSSSSFLTWLLPPAGYWWSAKLPMRGVNSQLWPCAFLPCHS